MTSSLAAALQGRYTSDREIGRGGMATVYLARDVRHNRLVALKVLNPELGAGLGVERFLDGESLYYRGPLGEVVKVDVTTGASFSIGQRRAVLTGDYLTDSSHPNWDVGRDGQFLLLKRAGAEAQTIVVHNWARELREKTAPRR